MIGDHVVTRIVLLVEGDGDREAVPELLRRTIGHLEYYHVSVAPRVMKVGDIRKIRRPGELERFVQYASSRDGEAILLAVDCDDGCAVEIAEDFIQRVDNIRPRITKKFGVVLFVKEFETMFLVSLPSLIQASSPNLWREGMWSPNTEYTMRRDAKSTLTQMMKGRAYKETRDQVRLTAMLDLNVLSKKYRPFQHLCNIVSQLNDV